jgi:hypothetical protein
MAWQLRGTGPVYYRSRRIGARVHRMFVGRGVVGELAEHVDQCLRRQRRRKAAALRSLTQTLQQLHRQQAAASAAMLVQIRAHLVTAGFYQHHRSEWRRRDMSGFESHSSETLRMPRLPTTPSDWRKLVDAANAGDPGALGCVREVLRKQPAIVATVTDLESRCRERALDLLCGGDAVWRETLRLKVEGLETELTAGSTSLAVKLAARRVALSWLTLQVVDGNCAEQAQCGPVPRRWQDYRDASERRYLTALKFFHSIHTLPNRDNRAHQSSAPRSAANGKVERRIRSRDIPDTTSVLKPGIDAAVVATHP